jgi:arylformamidase
MTKVYGNYTQAELDRQYEHRHIVPNMEDFTSRSMAESKRIRATLKSTQDIAYGPDPRQKVDVYPASGSRTPLVVWFHGGRWSMGSKEQSCQPAETLTRAGIAYVAANFRQAPNHRMDTIVDDARAAVKWAYDNAASFGADRDRLFVLGQSSGAHMGGMLAVTDWASRGLPANVVKGAMLVSGMYDLEPVRLTFRNEFLYLTEESAARNSPILHIPAKGCPLTIGYGALESEEFKRQSRDFAAAWKKAGNRCELIEREGHHHYSLAPDLNDAASPLVKSFLAMIGATAKVEAAE